MLVRRSGWRLSRDLSGGTESGARRRRSRHLYLAASVLATAALCAIGRPASAQGFFNTAIGVAQPFGLGQRIFSAFGNPMGLSTYNSGSFGYGYVSPNGGYYPAPAVPPQPVPAGAYYGPNTAPAAAEQQAAGASPQRAAPPVNTALYGTVPMVRTSESVDARIDKNNRLVVTWNGDPDAVTRITVALLNSQRKPIKETAITRVPTHATLALTSKTAYYRVTVDYANGTTTSMVSPL